MTAPPNVLWIIQRANSGAETQARTIAEHTDANVQLATGHPLNVDTSKPAIKDDSDVLHPTQDLDALVRSLDPVPDIVVFHNFNEHIADVASDIQIHTPTAVRVGMNFAEGALHPSIAPSVPGMIEWVRARDLLIAPSEAAARDLRAVGVSRDRIEVIPTMVEMRVDVEDPDLNAPYTVGHVAARCTPLKNQHLTVKTAAALRAMDPTYRASFNITGGQTNYRATLEQTAQQLNVADLCRFVGFVDDMGGYWEATGVSVLPSFSERHPSVVGEAAKAGVPTICADTRWAEEFDSVLTEPVDDPWSWAETIHDLLTNDAWRAQVAADQQEEVRERFGISAVVGQYADVFEYIMDNMAPYKANPEVVA